MQLYWNEQTACGTPRTVWQCFTVNDSVFLCRLLACRCATVFNQQPPIKSFTADEHLHFLLLLLRSVRALRPLTALVDTWRETAHAVFIAASLGFCNLAKRQNIKNTSEMFIWGRNISLGTGSPEKLKYTVCMQFTNIKVLIKKRYSPSSSPSFLCVLYKGLFVLK